MWAIEIGYTKTNHDGLKPQVRPEIIKLLEENVGGKLFDIELAI